MPVEIETQFEPNGTYRQVKTIHWNNSSDRKWLMNHLHHCMMNGKPVKMTPLCESI